MKRWTNGSPATSRPRANSGVVPQIPSGFAPAQFSPGFLDMSGPYYLKKDTASTIIGCRITAQHQNYIGVAHGGVLATMADVALSYQVYSSETPGLPVSTVSMTTNFLSGARLGEWIEASGTIDRIGQKLAYVHGSIWCSGRILMTMNAVYNIIRAGSG
jgi:acyl-coenzyme A thioesterase 13